MENEQQQVTDQFQGKSEEQMNDIAAKIAAMPIPIFLGANATQEEKELMNRIDDLVKQTNENRNTRFEAVMMNQPLYDNCCSLYFLSKLSEDEAYIQEQAAKKAERKKDLYIVLSKVMGFIKHYFKWEGDEEAIQYLSTGLKYGEWKETIQIACDKNMTNKEFTELLQTFEEEGMLFVADEDYATPVHKRTYCLSLNNEEFQLEILTQQLQKEQSKIAYSNAIIQGLNSRINAIKGVEVENTVVVDTIASETGIKPKKKRASKKKPVSNDGELKQTTEHLNDKQNEHNNG